MSNLIHSSPSPRQSCDGDNLTLKNNSLPILIIYSYSSSKIDNEIRNLIETINEQYAIEPLL
jgi:hypothetical protein